MRRAVAILFLLFASTSWTTLALAQSNNARAAALKREGDDNLAHRRFIEALDDYERAYALEPNPALHYNRGRALEFLARFPEAVDALLRFQAEASAELKARVPDLDAHVADLKAKVATVVITTNTPGARILLGGQEVGRSPLSAPVRVNAGRTTIDVIAQGYVDYHKDVDLQGGDTTTFGIQMLLRDTSSYLVVTSSVAASRVTIDAATIGLVPAEAKLAPGTHAVRVDHEGYSDAVTQVVLRAGERREIALDPIRSKPITTRWWFWTGMGAIVVGGVVAVLVYAFTTERAAPVGDFSPGKVSF